MSSLDDILREIEAEQQAPSKELNPNSAGLENLPLYEAEKRTVNSSPYTAPDMIGQVPQLTREMVGGGSVVSEQALTPQSLTARQRALPKISLHMVGSIVAIMVLMVGLGSSVLLSQRSQDVRQQAYEGQVQQQTVESSSEGSASKSETLIVERGEGVDAPVPGSSSAAAWWQRPVVIAGAAIVLSAALLLAAFFHWLFAI